MLISSNSCRNLSDRIQSGGNIFCRGLFLSARWFVLSQVVDKGLHFVVLPNKESAEYCCLDLYSLIEGDSVFFLPESGRNVERSNYKSSLAVQRTAAVNRINSNAPGLTVIVSYPEALSETIPSSRVINESILKLKVGEDISHDEMIEILQREGFEKVDFVSAPGQYAIRGYIFLFLQLSLSYFFLG